MAKRKKEEVMDDASSSSSSEFSLPLSFETGEAENVLADLEAIGFDKPMEFIGRYSARRVAQAVAYAKSKPEGTIRNLAGFIRYLVASPGGIPHVKKAGELENQKYSVFKR